MNVLSGVLDHWSSVEDCTAKVFHDDQNMMKIDFNLDTVNRKINYHGWMPKRYFTFEIFADLFRVLAMVGIEAGWVDDAEVACGEVDLFEIVFSRIAEAEVSLKSHSAACKQSAKV